MGSVGGAGSAAVPVHDALYVLAMGTDVDGVLRGKLVPRHKIVRSAVLAAEDAPLDFGFCGVIFRWDSMDVVYSAATSHDCAAAGYPDIVARIDSASLRPISLPQNATTALGDLSVVFLDFLTAQKEPLAFCPRSTLTSLLARLAGRGIVAHCGIELEWYTYRGQADSVLSGGPDLDPSSKTISKGMFGYSMLRPWLNPHYVSDILQSCRESGLAIDCFHTETGPGVYEIALSHSPALTAADECQLLKYIAKTVAYHHNLTASFMAKPWDNLPGCGGHIHLSLADPAGLNLFCGTQADGMSPLMTHFIAGILHSLPDLMPFLAPNINSYKRLDIKYWAPVVVGWGCDNRLAVVRVILSRENPDANRIEIRVPGADMNPYFAIAAILAMGLYGMQQEMSLPPPLDAQALLASTDPAQAIAASGYQRLPGSLREATLRMMAPDSVARKIFPAALIEHYGMTRLHEIKTFEADVTDWERQRYLELA